MKVDLEFRVLWTDYKIRDLYNLKLKKQGRRRISYDELSPEQRKRMTKTLNDLSILNQIWTPNLYFGESSILA